MRASAGSAQHNAAPRQPRQNPCSDLLALFLQRVIHFSQSAVFLQAVLRVPAKTQAS